MPMLAVAGCVIQMGLVLLVLLQDDGVQAITCPKKLGMRSGNGIQVSCVERLGTIYFQIRSAGLPDHSYDVNTAVEADVFVEFPAEPSVNLLGVAYQDPYRLDTLGSGYVGIALNGVPIKGPLLGADNVDVFQPPGGSGDMSEIVDACCGSTDPATGQYYYRCASPCLYHDRPEEFTVTTTLPHNAPDVVASFARFGGPRLLGYALDGWPIYSPYDARGELQRDLDNCNGRVSMTSSTSNGGNDTTTEYGYAYYATPEFPYMLGCFGPGVYTEPVEFEPSSDCPVGMYAGAARSNCVACPAGRFGEERGLTSPTCSGVCPDGSYCPQASSHPVRCPAGTYGAKLQQMARANGETLQYGLTDASCSGKCSAGYYCLAGSTSVEQNVCGDPHFFCPEGSAHPLPVSTGHYTVPEDEDEWYTRTAEIICPVGHYCPDYRRIECPPGVFANTTGRSTKACTAPCPPGHFCPQGTAEPLPCPAGRYTAETGTKRPQDCFVCPRGKYCKEGVTEPTDCPAGRYGAEEGLTTLFCSHKCDSDVVLEQAYVHLKNSGDLVASSDFTDPSEAIQNTLDAWDLRLIPESSGSSEEQILNIPIDEVEEILNVADDGHMDDDELDYDDVYDDDHRQMEDDDGFNEPEIDPEAGIGAHHSHTLSQITAVADPNALAHRLGQFCIATTCRAGFYCPKGSTQADSRPCGRRDLFCPQGSSQPSHVRRGFYSVGAASLKGGTPSLDDLYTRWGEEECEPGYFCRRGGRQPCFKGRYGATVRMESMRCTGPCSPGYYCHEASSTPEQFECGNASVYCPEASFEPTVVPPGYYSGGGAASVRWNITICEPGHYCINGIKQKCPAGRYGKNPGLSTPDCDGPCAAGYWCEIASTSKYQTICAPGLYSVEGEDTEDCTGICAGGFYCPAGSTSRTQHQCGGEYVYCPEGSGSPVNVTMGFYSTGGNITTRWSQSECRSDKTPPAGPSIVEQCPDTTQS